MCVKNKKSSGRRSGEEESLKQPKSWEKNPLFRECGTNPVIPVTGIGGQWAGREWRQGPAPPQEESSQPLKSPISSEGASQKAAQ